MWDIMIQASGAFTHLIIARTDSTDQTHDTRCACPLPLGAVAKAAKLIIFYQASELSPEYIPNVECGDGNASMGNGIAASVRTVRSVRCQVGGRGARHETLPTALCSRL